MTLTEKILARAAGKTRVEAGDNVWVKADILMTHDVCGPGTIGVFKREFGENARVWDRQKVVIIPDHYILSLIPGPIATWIFCASLCASSSCPIFTTSSMIPRASGNSIPAVARC